MRTVPGFQDAAWEALFHGDNVRFRIEVGDNTILFWVQCESLEVFGSGEHRTILLKIVAQARDDADITIQRDVFRRRAIRLYAADDPVDEDDVEARKRRKVDEKSVEDRLRTLERFMYEHAATHTTE